HKNPLPGGFLCFRKAGCGALLLLRASPRPRKRQTAAPVPPPCLVRRTRSAALPAARRVFVFSVDGLRCPAFASGVAAPSQKTDRGPSAASLPRPQDAVGGPARCQAGFCVFGRRVAVPCIFCAPSVALENSRPRPQRHLPA